MQIRKRYGARLNVRLSLRLAIITVLVIGVSSTQAAIAPLGTSGWEAVWDSALDPFVDINFVTQVGTSVLIQKGAQFTQGPDQFGVLPSIPIVFRQVAPSNVTAIVINDELITNSTGVDWVDFHFDLLDGPDAVFRNDQNFMFDTAPLNNQMFSLDDRSFWVDGFGLGPGSSDAVVANGAQWFPGDGAFDGDLIIDVVSQQQAPFTLFTLKETPSIPEPTSLWILGVGGVLVYRRRRRR